MIDRSRGVKWPAGLLTRDPAGRGTQPLLDNEVDHKKVEGAAQGIVIISSNLFVLYVTIVIAGP